MNHWEKVPQEGFMNEEKINFPTLWCKEPYCILTCAEEETFEDLQKRYPDAFKDRYGSIEQVLDIAEGPPNIYDIEIYIVESDDNGKGFYLISRGKLHLYDGLTFLKECVCIPLNIFALKKFYLEYVLPFKDLKTDEYDMVL